MRNLKAAGAALGDAILGGTVLDGLEEIGTDRGRHIVLFLLEAVTAGNAAAAGTGVLDVGGSHAEQIKARLADALRAQVAGGMIDQLRGVFAYVDVELAGLDKADEELAGVLHMGDNGLMLAEFREILGILLLEHELAARADRQNGDIAGRNESGERVHVPARGGAGVVEEAVRHHRQPAALELGHNDLIPRLFQHENEILAGLRVVVVHVTAGEKDGLLGEAAAIRGRQHRVVVAHPFREAPGHEHGHGRAGVHAELVEDEPGQRVGGADIDQPARKTAGQPAEHTPVGQYPVAQGRLVALAVLRTGQHVEGRNLDPGRTGYVAVLAVGTIVQRLDFRDFPAAGFVIQAETLGRRPGQLRPLEGPRRLGDGAIGHAGRAGCTFIYSFNRFHTHLRRSWLQRGPWTARRRCRTSPRHDRSRRASCR